MQMFDKAAAYAHKAYTLLNCLGDGQYCCQYNIVANTIQNVNYKTGLNNSWTQFFKNKNNERDCG